MNFLDHFADHPKELLCNTDGMIIHEKLKNYSKAENIYRKTLEIEPKNHQGMLRLSTLLIKTGKYDEARSFLESLTRKYPDYAVGWWNLGLLYESIYR